jgi:ribonuclease HII
MLIIGVDEAGRGPLFGRVYAGAAIINEDCIEKDILLLIKDSKKLSKKKRKIAFDYLINNIDYGVGYASEKEVDEVNILNATKLAMERAIKDIIDKYNIEEYKLLIDGINWEKYFDNCESVIKGDTKIKSISAASIIAKESHDNYIKDLCSKDPTLNDNYFLINNMGYGTKKHIEGIMKHGISIYHRKSFNIKKI